MLRFVEVIRCFCFLLSLLFSIVGPFADEDFGIPILCGRLPVSSTLTAQQQCTNAELDALRSDLLARQRAGALVPSPVALGQELAHDKCSTRETRKLTETILNTPEVPYTPRTT